MSNDNSVDNKLTFIAQNYLNIPTLEARNSDSLDFYDGLSVWSIKKALEAAYNAGYEAGNIRPCGLRQGAGGED